MGRKRSVAREGILLGLIGYGAVAVFYALFDLLASRGAVFTLNLLGKVLFRGARDPAILQFPISTDIRAMVAYNFLHLFVALAVGLFVAWLVARVEERPSLGPPVLALLVSGFVATIVLVRFLTQEVGPLLPFWSIMIANTLVALGGGTFLWYAHPGLWSRARVQAEGER
jgi:membrane-bound metal-dependent hydrolase YbcI (DUF457 family)